MFNPNFRYVLTVYVKFNLVWKLYSEIPNLNYVNSTGQHISGLVF